MIKRLLSVLAGLAIGLTAVQAKPFLTYVSYSESGSELQGRITSQFQSRDGYIWVATFNGLCKFDSYSFTKYKSQPDRHQVLTSNRLNFIKENSRGDIWCTSDRIYLFQPGEERFLDVQQSIDDLKPGLSIFSVYTLSNGVTYLISTEGDLFRTLDAQPVESMERVTIDSKDKLDYRGFFSDSWGNEWIMTTEGLYLYGRDEVAYPAWFSAVLEVGSRLWFVSVAGNFVEYNPDTRLFASHGILAGGRTNDVIRLEDCLYVASNEGVFEVSTRTGKSTRLTEAGACHLSACHRGDQSEVWGMTLDHRAFRLDREQPDGIEVFPLPEDHRFESPRLVFHQDAKGLIWLLFYDSLDILYFDKEQSAFVRPDHPIKTRSKVESCFIDQQGNAWYKLSHELLCITLHNHPFDIPGFVLEDEIRAIMQDSLGRMWTAYRNGQVCLYSGEGRRLGALSLSGQVVEEATFDVIYSMKEDSRGCIWLGSRHNGLYRLEPGSDPLRYRCTQYLPDETDPNSLSNASVYDIEEDSFGRIWVGTFGGGLNLWNDGTFVHSGNGLGHMSLSEPPMVIRCVKEVKPGVLMVGSKEGLFALDTRFEHPGSVRFYRNHRRINDDYSLIDNDVMSLLATSRGEIYLSTSTGGVSKVVSDNLLTESIRFQTITHASGLGSDIAYALAEDSLGHVWVVGPQNLSRIDADGSVRVYNQTFFPAPVVFSEARPLTMAGEVYFGQLKGLLRMTLSQLTSAAYRPPLQLTQLDICNVPSNHRLKGDTLKLAPSERIFSLHFAVLNFHDSESRKYAYRLDGVDKDWTETRENAVTYINLPKGRHLFHLRTTDEEGRMLSEEKTLLLNVQPRFFESWWGITILVVVALLLMLLVVRIAVRISSLRHEVEVERQLTETKLQFFTDVSHELRTPLSLVDGPVSEVLQDKGLSNESKQHLELAQKNIRRMLNLVNQILDFRKVQSEKMKLLLESLDVVEETRRVVDNFVPLARQHRIDFRLEAPECPLRVWLDRDKYDKMLSNLLSNAFKYTPDGRCIRVEVKDGTDRVEVAVVDQGVGIRKDRIQKIFQTFETVVEANLLKDSSGIGLSLVKRYVDMHHAEILVQSAQGEGSTFKLQFLKGNRHFEKDDNVEYYANDFVEEPRAFVKGTEPASSDLPAIEHKSEKPTVLVVEDNPELSEFIRQILQDTCRVMQAGDGLEGLDMAHKKWPDLIITDLMMPRMDGFEMIRHIKEDPDIYLIPIIVLTAKAGMDNRIQGVELGVDDYVMKPFSSQYLKARVASLLAQRRRMKEKYMETIGQGANAIKRISLEPDMPKITPADELFIQDVMAFMEENMDNADLSIDEFASAVHLGRTVFYNKLKATLGLSPVDFVQEMRVKRAMQLIQTRNFTISEVAYKTGFNDPKYFSRCFKKFYGESPSEYLKKNPPRRPDAGAEA